MQPLTTMVFQEPVGQSVNRLGDVGFLGVSTLGPDVQLRRDWEVRINMENE